MLQVRAFGKLRLDGRQSFVDHFPTRHVEELVGFLLLQPQIKHPREKLIGLLWPDAPAARGRPRLSLVLTRLRKLFQQLHTPFDQYVQTTREWVLFAPQRPFTFDRDQFVTHCQAGLRTDDLARKEPLLQTAVSLYRADLMEGIYAEWCLAEREYLAWLRSQALGALMHCCMQRRAYDEAVAYGQQILAAEPLREEAHRALMHCYAALDRHDLAAQQYQLCRQLLQAELGENPLPDTIHLYRQILENRATGALADDSLSSQRKAGIAAALRAFHTAADHLDSLLP